MPAFPSNVSFFFSKFFFDLASFFLRFLRASPFLNIFSHIRKFLTFLKSYSQFFARICTFFVIFTQFSFVFSSFLPVLEFCVSPTSHWRIPNSVSHQREPRGPFWESLYYCIIPSCRNPGCDIEILSKLDLKACGVPLEIFQMGNLCFPYLSISYLDFLSSPGVRGFVAGATNVLFKQKRPLADVLVEIDEGKIEIFCPELRKQLALTGEDLRFMDILLRGVEEERSYENWIRDHFLLYMVALLRTSLLTGSFFNFKLLKLCEFL